MADITMCNSEFCPLKKRCYRHEAQPSNWQSWFSQPPWKGDKCDEFWEMEYRDTGEQGGEHE